MNKMGKKKNRYNDILTLEDQQRTLENIDAMLYGYEKEKKKGDIRDLGPIKKAKDKNKSNIGKNGLPREVSQAIIKADKKARKEQRREYKDNEMLGYTYESPASSNITNDYTDATEDTAGYRAIHEDVDPNEKLESTGGLSLNMMDTISNALAEELGIDEYSNETEQEDTEATTANPLAEGITSALSELNDQGEQETLTMPTARQITFRRVPATDRFVVDDGIVPNGIITDSRNLIPQITGTYDDDELEEMAMNCIRLGIVSKHPSAIFLRDEILEESRFIVSFNSARFIFALHNQYIFAYYVDTDSLDALVTELRAGTSTSEEFLANTVGFLKAIDTESNGFYYADPDALHDFIDYWSPSDVRMDFLDVFSMDEDTVTSDEDSDENAQSFTTFSLESLAMIVNTFIEGAYGDIFGSSMDDEDYYDDDEDVDVPSNARPVASVDITVPLEDKEEASLQHTPEEKEEEPIDEPSHIVIPVVRSGNDDTSDTAEEEVSDEELLSEGVEMVQPDAEDTSMVLGVTHKKGTR